jgi:transcriptional regulator with XRE-family HTH domain
MTKVNFVFTKEMGDLLKEFRLKAGLSQAELGERIGFSKKTAYSQISHLENGIIKNPPIGNIILYLKACGVSLVNFFQKLSAIDFKLEHEKIMKQVEMPSSLNEGLRKKIDRDTALYLNKVQYPKTPLRTKIDKKVKVLLFNHQLDENGKRPYFNLTNELISNYDTGQIPAILKKHGQARILKYGIIDEIRKIVYQTVRIEQYRLKKQKALPSEKFRKMSGEFLRYRVKIEPIEAEVQKKLGELNVPIVQNQAYKNFTRECYQAIKKYFYKDRLLLKQRFAEIMKTYKAQELKEDVLLQIREMIMSKFQPAEEKK